MNATRDSWPTYRTRVQTLALLYGWGYSAGSLPDQRTPEVYCSIDPMLRTDPTITRARFTFGPVNEGGQRLYGLEFIP